MVEGCETISEKQKDVCEQFGKIVYAVMECMYAVIELQLHGALFHMMFSESSSLILCTAALPPSAPGRCAAKDEGPRGLLPTYSLTPQEGSCCHGNTSSLAANPELVDVGYI